MSGLACLGEIPAGGRKGLGEDCQVLDLGKSGIPRPNAVAACSTPKPVEKPLSTWGKPP
jgi:hypothetical protein